MVARKQTSAQILTTDKAARNLKLSVYTKKVLLKAQAIH